VGKHALKFVPEKYQKPSFNMKIYYFPVEDVFTHIPHPSERNLTHPL
jgi:hypothetical protein